MLVFSTAVFISERSKAFLLLRLVRGGRTSWGRVELVLPRREAIAATHVRPRKGRTWLERKGMGRGPCDRARCAAREAAGGALKTTFPCTTQRRYVAAAEVDTGRGAGLSHRGRPGRILAKAMDLRVLIAGDGRHAWHEEAWVRALRDMGHEVRLFAFSEFFGSVLGRIQNRLLLGPRIGESNRALLRLAHEFQPDVFLAYRALHLLPRTLAALREGLPNARLVSYQNDNIFGALKGKSYWRLFRRALPLFDLHLVYRSQDVARFLDSGAKRAQVLRSFYLPWLHRRISPLELRGPSVDIGFYGHSEPDHRLDQLDYLMRHLPAQYEIRGTDWARWSRGRAWAGMNTTPLHLEDYVQAINRTRLCLCFLSSWNQDSYTRRCFEIPACGSLLLSQRTDDLLTLYEEDKEAVFFSSAEELVDKAGFYLRHPTARDEIAGMGQRRCIVSGYDIHSRMKEWLALL